MSISDFFTNGNVDLTGLTQWLNGLTPAARKTATMQLTPAQQQTLYDAADGYLAVGLNDLVPASVPDMTPVIQYGRNSLFIFKYFQKPMCRPAGGTDTLWGYNKTSTMWIIGPGYFVAYASPDGTEVFVDYTKLPTSKPEGWPRITSNSSWFSAFVYKGMRDTVRGVANGVTIARVSRNGKPADNWFVLCRDR